MKEETSPERGTTTARGDAIRTTAGTMLAALLGLVTTFGVSGLGLDVYESALIWVVIAWTLIGMAVAGLWPLLRGVRRTRGRTGLVAVTLASLVAASCWIVLTGRPKDGSNPVALGCREINGLYRAGASQTINRTWGLIGTVAIVYNTFPKCGLVWAEFLTPKNKTGKDRYEFVEKRIRAIKIDLVRGSAPNQPPQKDEWNHATAPVKDKDWRDIWTPGLRLGNDTYTANLHITFTNGETVNERLTWPGHDDLPAQAAGAGPGSGLKALSRCAAC